MRTIGHVLVKSFFILMPPPGPTGRWKHVLNLSVRPPVNPNVTKLVDTLFGQEAQLSQRDRATLHVIEYFAKSLKITKGHSE